MKRLGIQPDTTHAVLGAISAVLGSQLMANLPPSIVSATDMLGEQHTNALWQRNPHFDCQVCSFIAGIMYTVAHLR